MNYRVRRLATTFLLPIALGGCSGDPPRVFNVRCTPQMLSVAGPGPYTVDCQADCSGTINYAYWRATDVTGAWASADDDSGIVDCTHMSAQLTSAEAPDIGALTIEVRVEECDDCSPGNTETTQIEVVP